MFVIELRPLTLILFFSSTVLISHFCVAQEGKTLFGVQLKPIVPTNYFNSGTVELSDTNVNIDISPKTGYSFGMVVRHNFTNTISFETGINTIRRNYNVFSKIDNQQTDFTDFGFVSYEIPLQGLIYIRLSEKIYMNASTGLGINWYASDVNSSGENNLIYHYSQRARWMGMSFLANLGFEYRTKKSGIFYLGASLVNPFSPITRTHIYYEYDTNKQAHLITDLNGNYLTIDLRWFFPENDDGKKK